MRGLARTIAFRTEGVGTRAGRAFGGNDATVGDPEFDRTLYAEGPTPSCERSWTGRRGGACSTPSAGAFLRTLHREDSQAARGTLEAAGSPADEAALLAALQDEYHALRIAAAEALGVVGTTEAVLVLKAVEAGSSAQLQKAAREAIARIQERQVGARPGQLALAAGPKGQLALAEDERGRVALPDERKPV
jgi:hypothetical protein